MKTVSVTNCLTEVHQMSLVTSQLLSFVCNCCRLDSNSPLLILSHFLFLHILKLMPPFRIVWTIFTHEIIPMSYNLSNRFYCHPHNTWIHIPFCLQYRESLKIKNCLLEHRDYIAAKKLNIKNVNIKILNINKEQDVI